jgi:hypothetical protein
MPGRDNQPTVFHETRELAVTEAERLCKKTGGRFYLFKLEATCEPGAAEWTPAPETSE